MADDVQTILDNVNRYLGRNYVHLKEKQAQAIKSCRLNDVLCILPTGYGKTLIIETLPFLESCTVSCAVVANPLNAIICEQKQKFGDKCIVIDSVIVETLKSGKQDTTVEKLKSGHYKFIIGHPENLQKDEVKHILQEEPLSSMISHLVVDEAHCIISWGQSKFRPAFLDLGLLRAILSRAKILALTATANKKAETEITSCLLMVNPVIIKESPDRPNMFLQVNERLASSGHIQASYDQVLDPVFDQLKNEGKEYPRTIIYMPLKWCGYAHHRYLSHFTSDDKAGDMKSFVAQFHAPQTAEMKNTITTEMQNPDSELRVLFCTEAYSMGADPAKVKSIIHIGPANNLETYIQEIGRCGRDGGKCSAVLYFNKSDIASNVKHLQPEMREFCKLTSCRREYLLGYFEFAPNEERSPHDCCDNCRSQCKCSICENDDAAVTNESERRRDANKEKCIIRSLLQYFDCENSLISNCLLPDAVTGLSNDCAAEISRNYMKYVSLKSLKDDFPFLNENYANNIVTLLQSHLSL